jgi:ubiquinol-cytochrome c reductase cytochrome c1 subunit
MSAQMISKMGFSRMIKSGTMTFSQLVLSMLCVALLGVSGAALAAGGAGLNDPAGNDVADTASLQRGVRNYVNYCMGCHSMQYVRYNSIGEDLELTDDQLINNLMFAADKVSDPMQIAMPAESAEIWFGLAPPDLSLIARSRGANYLYNYMRAFYLDESRPIGVNNLLLPNASMPHVLWELQGTQRAIFDEVEYAPGMTRLQFAGFEQVTPGELSPEEYDMFVRDLVNFLDYAGAPEQLQRNYIGIWVILFLLVFLLFSYLLKEEIWKDVK